MKKLILFILLVGLSVVCFGQGINRDSIFRKANKNSVMGNVIKYTDSIKYSKLQQKPNKIKGRLNYLPTGGHSTLVNSLVEDNKIIKKDTIKSLHISGYISAYPIYNGYTGWATTMPNEYLTVGNGCTKVKVSVTKDLVVTIHIDEFKVTDTIWISKGKQKVGIPAYRFLEYFKDDYPTLTWPNGRLEKGSSLFYNITPTTK